MEAAEASSEGASSSSDLQPRTSLPPSAMGQRVASESAASLKKLFDKLDITKDGRICSNDLKTIMNSLRLFPSPAKVKEIIARVNTKGTGYLDFEEFCEMRNRPEPAELNVIAQFKKFDVDTLHKGFITEKALRKVLESEGYRGDALNDYIRQFMLSDQDNDGKVSFKDLFERMMQRVPEEWLTWLWENTQRGVADSLILGVLTQNGFKFEVADILLKRTKAEGQLTVERTYADLGQGYIYQVRC